MKKIENNFVVTGFVGKDAEIRQFVLPLENIPVGTVIHNIELRPGQGAALVRSAGNFAQLKMCIRDRYYITKLRKGAKGEGLTFYGPEEAWIAYNEGKVDIHAIVNVVVKDLDKDGKIVGSTTGCWVRLAFTGMRRKML